MQLSKSKKLVPLLVSFFIVSFLPLTSATADEVTEVPVFPSTYVDSQNYDLNYVYDTELRDPKFSVEVTANSISLRGVSGFEDVKSILWKVLDEDNNELFWRGNDDDDNLDMRDSVNEYLYDSIGTTPLTTYDGDDLDGVTPLPSFVPPTMDEGSESIIRSCARNNYLTPGTTEIPGRFEANTEYRIYMAIYADNPATDNCAEVVLDHVIFTGIYTNQHDLTWESTATTLDITVSNWDPSVVEDFAFVLCDASNPLEDTFTECINAPPYDIDSNNNNLIDDAEFFASADEEWTPDVSRTISFVGLEPSTNYDFHLQFFELVGSTLTLMENYSLTEGIPYEEAIEVTALYSLSTSAVPPPSSPGGGSSGGSGAPPLLPQLPASVTQFVLSDPSKLKDSYFKSLDANQIGSVSVSQFSKLPAKTLALLTPVQVSALTFDQLKALKPSQVVALKPAVIAALNSTQIAALQPADFKLMKTTQIARISGEAAAGLAKSDLNAFTQTQLRSLTTNAVKNLKPEVLKSLSVNKLRQFSPRQIRSLTDEQKSVLTTTQKSALRIK
jgi:hypothetical protein